MHLLDCVCVFDCFGIDSLHVFDRTWVGVYLSVCVCVRDGEIVRTFVCYFFESMVSRAIDSVHHRILMPSFVLMPRFVLTSCSCVIGAWLPWCMRTPLIARACRYAMVLSLSLCICMRRVTLGLLHSCQQATPSVLFEDGASVNTFEEKY